MSVSGGVRSAPIGDHGAQLVPAHQRDLANLRERKRMMLINKGFELLKNRLPIKEIQASKNPSHKGKSRCRLTKVDILRLTIDYIRSLSTMLNSGKVTETPTLLMNKPDRSIRLRVGREKNSGTRPIKRQYADDSPVFNEGLKPERKANRELVVLWKLVGAECVLSRRYLLSWSESEREETRASDLKTSKLWTPKFE